MVARRARGEVIAGRSIMTKATGATELLASASSSLSRRFLCSGAVLVCSSGLFAAASNIYPIGFSCTQCRSDPRLRRCKSNLGFKRSDRSLASNLFRIFAVNRRRLANTTATTPPSVTVTCAVARRRWDPASNFSSIEAATKGREEHCQRQRRRNATDFHGRMMREFHR